MLTKSILKQRSNCQKGLTYADFANCVDKQMEKFINNPTSYKCYSVFIKGAIHKQRSQDF